VQKEGRKLPWREEKNAYKVWISEVMLQQTQVKSVIPYFLRWMERFPTIESLAAASEQEVLKAWEGLGYYSRAKQLHLGAKTMMKQHQGLFPEDPLEIAQLKGIGPYTLAAIAAFAFNQPLAPVDGNVMRVLTRFYNIQEDICKTSTQKDLRKLAQAILPEKNHAAFSEALIELGATICTKKPLCLSCPIQDECKAFLHQTTDQLPVKSKKILYEKVYKEVAVICTDDHVKLHPTHHLFEFPSLIGRHEPLDLLELHHQFEEAWQLPLTFVKPLQERVHHVTRFKITLRPYLFTTTVKDQGFYPFEKLSLLPFFAGHKTILDEFFSLSL
jgi:A/G-specific adenine glycosylase